MASESQYIFGEGSEAEFERLVRQGRIVEPTTRRVFEMAGIAPGMRVLDIGCGVGEVARVAADLVGPTGHVTGIDRDAAALAFARKHLAGRNVDFQQAEVDAYAPGSEFDAVVGRFILMHVKDPVATLRRAAQHTRSGGIVCFVEPWHGTAVSHPRVDAFHTFIEGGNQAFRTAGIHLDMAGRLYADFIAAGLPAPHLHMEAAGGAGDAKEMFDLMLDSARSGIRATVPEAQRAGALAYVEGLAAQMRADATAKNATMLMMLNFGAWSRKP